MITHQHIGVGHQVVPEYDRLRALQMGIPRQDRCGMELCLVRQRADQPAAPVEVLRGGIQGHAADIGRHLCHVGIQGQEGAEGGGAEADPLHAPDLLRHAAGDKMLTVQPERSCM